MASVKRVRGWVLALACLCALPCAPGWAAESRNAIVFVADGLRRGSVNATDAPALQSVRERGVDFTNSHSLFPTLTTPNASAIATGHYLGDTGDFGNSLYAGFPVFNRGNFGKPAGTPVPFIENDPVLGDLDDHFERGSFLNEETLLALARRKGFNTAAIGKLGPVAIQDVSQIDPQGGRFEIPRTVILDDATGSPGGIPLPDDIEERLIAAGLGVTPTTRTQPSGNVDTPGTLSANVGQQQWFADAATKVVLPGFVRDTRPFVLVFWSRDPDGSQHNQGDSLNTLTPGINGPTSHAGVANADRNLKQLLDFIDSDAKLSSTTDVFITSDHGFATISKHQTDARGAVAHGFSATFEYVSNGRPEVVAGWLPPGFLAIDLAHELDLPLYDPDAIISVDQAAHYQAVDPSKAMAHSRQRPSQGNGLIGGTGLVQDKTDARVVVAANGGADLIYIPERGSSARDRSDRRRLAARIVNFLLRQDYTGGVFLDSALGRAPGALPLQALGLEGSALLPRPAVVVSFATFRTAPEDPLSTAQISDTTLQEGQGMHGSLDRSNTLNNMAAVGPDFKHGFTSDAPVGNADIAPTLAHVLGLTPGRIGRLQGRVLHEALLGGPDKVRFRRDTLRSASANGKITVLRYQQAQGRRYFDAACLLTVKPGRIPRPDALDGCTPASTP